MGNDEVKYVCACRLADGTKHLIHIGDCSMEEIKGVVTEHLPTAKTILIQVPRTEVPFAMDPQTA
jgi:hypothetical protein